MTRPRRRGENFGRSLDLLTRRDLAPMVGSRFPLSAFQQALDTAKNPQSGAEVMITPLV